MDKDSKFTRTDDGYIAVRTVSGTEALPASDKDYLFARDTNGNIAMRVVGSGGGGGGDSHNKGYYATPEALRTAYPTASAGDYAIVGSTDTVWVWDTDTTAWVNSGTAGQVTSVNGQTGDVTVQATLVSGTNIKTVDGNSILGSGNLELSTYLTYPAGWTTNSTTKAFCDDIAADTTAVAGKAYLGEVTFSDLPASMANAEVVVEIMSGTTASNKIIKLTCSSGNTSPYAWQYTYWNNGTNTSGWQTWATSSQGAKADTAVQPGDLATVATTGDYGDLLNKPTIPSAQVNSDWNASTGVAQILNKPTLGTMASANASDYTPTSGLATVATSGLYSDLTGTPTIPDAIQYSTMPTAASTNEGDIVQFIGTTDTTYTNGYFYKCVSDGQNPATYSWTQIDVQPVGATINDNATTSLTETWSANKLTTTLGDIETLLAAI